MKKSSICHQDGLEGKLRERKRERENMRQTDRQKDREHDHIIIGCFSWGGELVSRLSGPSVMAVSSLYPSTLTHLDFYFQFP